MSNQSSQGPPIPLKQTGGVDTHTDARGDGGAALLIAFGTAVAGDACHTVLAGTLAGGLIAGLASSTHRVAITGCEEHKREGSERQLVPFAPRGVPWSLPQRGKHEKEQVGLTKLAHALQVLGWIAYLPPKSKWTCFKGLLEE